MDPSSFDKRIIIETNSRSADGMGGFTDSWSTAATVWASVTPLNGHEKFQAMQMETPVTHKVKARYDSNFTTSNRINWDSRIFNIVEVLNPDERKSFVELKVVEGAA